MTTDNTLQELLPCPFCNIHVVETARGYAVHHRAGCFMGAKGSTYFLPHEAAAWNTRTQPAPAVTDSTLQELLPLMRGARIFSIKKMSSGNFLITERCDEYFDYELTPVQLFHLGNEIAQLSGVSRAQPRYTLRMNGSQVQKELDALAAQPAPAAGVMDAAMVREAMKTALCVLCSAPLESPSGAYLKDHEIACEGLRAALAALPAPSISEDEVVGILSEHLWRVSHPSKLQMSYVKFCDSLSNKDEWKGYYSDRNMRKRHLAERNDIKKRAHALYRALLAAGVIRGV